VPSYSPSLIRFGAFEMDLSASELRRAGARIKLQPQPFKVLAVLANRAGEVVTRDDLEQQVWGSETHVDFDLSLNYCIKQIRSALKDDAETPQFIETLPRRGYRFIASVERRERSVRKTRAMLAVLPFGNLTGNPDQIAQMLSEYRVYAKKVPLKDGDYTMDHTALIYLMDRDGKFVAPFNLNRKPEEAAADLKRYL